jgi:hypothetical protein
MAGLPSPHLRAKSPFPALWTGFLAMAILTVVALGLSIGEWRRPIAGVLVDAFGLIDNFGWPGWSAYRQGVAYPDRVNAVNGHHLSLQNPGADLDHFAAQALAGSSLPGSQVQPASPSPTLGSPPSTPGTLKLLIEQPTGFRVISVQVERLGLPAWLVLCGGYLLLAWVWLGAAGILYTARPQSRAVSSFVRWVVVAAVLLITLFDLHTTRRLVPITLLAYACLPAALVEIGLCFPERIAILQSYPRLLWLLRLCDAVLASLLLYGYIRHHNFRGIADVATGISIVALTIILALRCVQAEGRRRVQLLVALLLLLPIYLLVGGMLLWSPEHAAPYLYVVVIPTTVIGALGMAYALLRFDLWDSRTLLRKPGLRPLLTAVLAFVISLVGAVGFVGTRSLPESVQVLYVVVLVGGTGALLRRAGEWIDLKLFPADVRYQATVEQLSMRFTDLSSTAAVAEVVEQAVGRSVDCARVRLLPIAAPVWMAGNDSKNLGRFLPKVAQVMAAAIENQRNDTPEGTNSPPADRGYADPGGSRDSGDAAPPPHAPVAVQGLPGLRQAVKSASLFALSPEQEQALLRGELVYLAPVRQLNYSVQALWSWLLVGVRFRDHIIGLIAVAPKSVAQVFTPATESLLRTIANQAALALFCAGLSEQLEARRRTQELLLHEQVDLAMSVLAREVEAGLAGGSQDSLLQALQSLTQMRPLRVQPQRLRELIEQARLLRHDRLRTRLLELDLLPGIELDCDSDAVSLLLSNLLGNALAACPPPGRIGINSNIEPDQSLRLSVWDTSQAAGEGETIAAPRLLARPAEGSAPPQATTSAARIAALHLAIAELIGQAHGFVLRYSQRAGRHCADVVIPSSAWRKKKVVEGTGITGELPSGHGADDGAALSPHDSGSAGRATGLDLARSRSSGKAG